MVWFNSLMKNYQKNTQFMSLPDSTVHWKSLSGFPHQTSPMNRRLDWYSMGILSFSKTNGFWENFWQLFQYFKAYAILISSFSLIWIDFVEIKRISGWFFSENRLFSKRQRILVYNQSRIDSEWNFNGSFSLKKLFLRKMRESSLKSQEASLPLSAMNSIWSDAVFKMYQWCYPADRASWNT